MTPYIEIILGISFISSSVSLIRLHKRLESLFLELVNHRTNANARDMLLKLKIEELRIELSKMRSDNLANSMLTDLGDLNSNAP